MRNFVSKTILSIGLVVAAAPMQAAILNGTLNFAGDVRVTASAIDFLPLGGGNGNVINTNTQSGSFTAVTSGSTATILDLSNPPYPPGPVNIPSFLSNFSSFPGLNFTVRNIFAGNLAGTPFNLTNFASGGSTVTFVVGGTVSDGTTSPASNFIGQFTSNFPTQSTSQLLAAIAGSPGFVQNSFSATFVVSSVPEPGTTALLASGGLLLLAGGMFRRKQKA